MKEQIEIQNRTAELADCADCWSFDRQYDCWCLEDVLYTQKAMVPKFQRLSIFVPKAYLRTDGTIDPAGTSHGYTAATVPVVFENNSAGYMQMPHTWLGGPRNYARQYLDAGFVYVSSGCRGRESRDENGEWAGKAPLTLVDLKTALRFLRHNRAVLPGNWDRVISVGWSAGGAMSALLGVTGDSAQFDGYLQENGAFMEESDAVYAAQIYCPIIDLEHADLAYEWMFGADKTCETSPAGPAETMTPFKRALSKALSTRYVGYFNSLSLRNPLTGEPLTLSPDGRGGTAYAYLMDRLNDSATDFLQRLQAGTLPLQCAVPEYLAGEYTYQAPGELPPLPNGDPGLHHAGPGAVAPPLPGNLPMSLGDLMSRPPCGMPAIFEEPPMVTCAGSDKRGWLSWDGNRAALCSLDAYVREYRRRMKPCTAFDKLSMDSGENQEFGTGQNDYIHFSTAVGEALREVEKDFPAETARYLPGYAAIQGDAALAQRVALLNPMGFIGRSGDCRQAAHYRIRVGAHDADTSLSVSMTLALRLANAGCGDVDYAIVWDQPHAEADYPGEVCDWIRKTCADDVT